MNLTRNIAFAVCWLWLTTAIVVGQNYDFKRGFVADELLVKFDAQIEPQTARAQIEQTGAKVLQEFPDLGWRLIKLPANVDVNAGLARFNYLSSVRDVQPNFIYKIDLTPNDANYNSLYGMTKISAPTAWSRTTGDKNVVVAVIDTGVRYTHEDLAANMWRNTGEIPGNGIDDDGDGFVDDVYGYNFANNTGDPIDDYGHGTHCAGTIGAVGNNSKGVTGVNWNVSIMAIKTHDAQGNSTAAKLIAAYNYVRMMKQRGVNVRVTSNSYGGAPEAPAFDQATKDAVDALGAADVLNVFAAGNDGRNTDVAPAYPASYDSPSIVSVAASNSTDDKAGFSNFGVTTVDLAAPGVGILSTMSGSDQSYGNLSGTSMATPHTAGAAALIAAAYPGLSAQAIKTRLLNSVDRLPQWNNLVVSGGRLNVAKAIAPSVLDFDGDGRADLSAIQNVNGSMVWHNLNSLNGYAAQYFGLFANDTAVPADFDGDGKTDLAVWRGGTKVGDAAYFYVLNSQNNTFRAVQFGTFGDAPQTAVDFDGDGKADFAVTRKTGNQLVWYVLQSRDGFTAAQFGLSDDLPIRGDFDGDGKTDFAVYRGGNSSAANTFFVLKSSNSQLQTAQFGNAATDRIISGDFDGDGKTDFAVWRGSNGVWYWLNSSDNSFHAFQFGTSGDLPVPADYDGDGKTDFAVWRANSQPDQSAIFYINGSVNGFSAAGWGQSGMRIPASNFQIGY